MISKIKQFFLEQRKMISILVNELSLARDNINSINAKVCTIIRSQAGTNAELMQKMARIELKISSIEMEMLIARGACLDNNFEGKEDL